MQTYNLWPVPFYDFRWNEHLDHKTRLKQICDEQSSLHRQSNVSPDAKRDLYESPFDFLEIDDPSVLALSHYIKECFFKAAAASNKEYWPPGLNIEINIHESWCHVTHDGGSHDRHIHPNSSWSAIYYLDTADMDNKSKNGVNRFYCPYNNMYLDAGQMYLSTYNSIDIRAEEGQLLVFPSWVDHSALTYRGQRNRYIIAANCKIRDVNLSSVTIKV